MVVDRVYVQEQWNKRDQLHVQMNIQQTRKFTPAYKNKKTHDSKLEKNQQQKSKYWSTDTAEHSHSLWWHTHSFQIWQEQKGKKLPIKSTQQQQNTH